MKYSFIILSFLISEICFGQPTPEEEGNAYLSKKNYIEALPIFKKLAKANPANEEYRYKAGLCYMNTYTSLPEAISNLEFACIKNKTNPEYFFNLGLAYQHSNEFDKAISAFENCKTVSAKKDIEKVEHQIENCLHGKEFLLYPVNITFQNLSKTVNSVYPDYYPLIPEDESYLVYTTRRPLKPAAKPELDGYFSSDIYMSTPKDGAWLASKSAGLTINSLWDEEATDLTCDGKKMTVYLDHIDSVGNLYVSENTKTGFKRIEKLNEKVNEGFESAGAVDAQGDVIVFASKRKGGVGERDIYIIRRLSSGVWATPENLGTNVNTKYNEDFPKLSKDGKTLYFASEGHTSMGGFDIFKSEWNEEKKVWSAPQNMGYPINDTYDNENISYAGDGTHAYISAIRKDGLGDLDIYKIKFNDAEPHYCIITGYVTTSDSIAANIKIKIQASTPESKEVLKFIPVHKTGKYVMALVPGSYTLDIRADGYEEVVIPYTVYDVPFQPEKAKDFLLKRKK